MKVIWTPEAQQDRLEIWEFIVAHNPQAAARMDQLFGDAAARLAAHPPTWQSRANTGHA